MSMDRLNPLDLSSGTKGAVNAPDGLAEALAQFPPIAWGKAPAPVNEDKASARDAKTALLASLMPSIKKAVSHRRILDVEVCDYDWAQALALVNQVTSVPVGQTVVSFLNANNANLAHEHPAYANVLSRQLILPDGHGVDIASRMLYGSKFPANLNGTDFVPALLTYIATPKRVGLIGAKPEVLEAAVRVATNHAPWHTFIAISDGYFDKENCADVIARVADADLDILLVAMGSPLQETWVDRNIRPEHARLVVTVGALFDFLAGRFPRAPRWMRAMRLEWIFRMTLEPRRLWRRYLVGNPLFLARILRQKVSLRKVKGRKAGSLHSPWPAE